MNIRSKLAWTYIILLIIGIITISTYSILSIRSFLLADGAKKFENDAKSLAVAVSRFDSENFDYDLQKLSEFTGYEIQAYDSLGKRFVFFPDSMEQDNDELLSAKLVLQLSAEGDDPPIYNTFDNAKLIVYVNLNNTINDASYLRVSQYKSTYFGAIASIRHIIYSGMLFSIMAVVIVSFMFARYMAAPIQFLTKAALDIAEGNMDREIEMNRSDEFGTLSESLNKMSTRLKEDNEELKRLNEQQQQFYADITHEIRNPLHTIVGSLEMMELENVPDEKKGKYLNTAKRQALRLGRLFEDIKTLQRYDIDREFIKKEHTNIHHIAENVAETYRILAEEKGIELITNCELKTCIADVDPDKIEQVLDNLVSNAIKYSTKGTIEIRCKIDHGNVMVSVSDEGEGIAHEHIERLFDRFYRTDKARSRDKGGTGLGLSIVRGILKAHDSDIEVTSKIGVGSIFFFKLKAV